MRTKIFSCVFVAALALACMAEDATEGIDGDGSGARPKSDGGDTESLLREHLVRRKILIDRAVSELKQEIGTLSSIKIEAKKEDGAKDIKAALEQYHIERDKTLTKIEHIMELLGDMHATEAISILVDNLTLIGLKAEVATRDLPDEMKYPALKTLIKIGDSGIKKIIDSIRTFKADDGRARVVMSGLVEVLGKDATRAVLFSKKEEAVGYLEALQSFNRRYPERLQLENDPKDPGRQP